MATQIKHRRGTTSEHSTFTGSEAEITVDTTKDTLIVHDGSTAGGHELAKADGSNIAFGDNVKAKFGADDDLQIYHDGSHSFVKDNGTGMLVLQTNGTSVNIEGHGGAEYMARFIQDGAVELYYDYSNNTTPKLATTSTGIDISGAATMDGLTVDGGATTTLKAGGFTANSETVLELAENRDGSNNLLYGFKFKTDGAGDNNFHLTRHSNSTTGDKALSVGRDTGDISFYDNTGSAKFHWDAADESLGIGTSSPSRNLHIKGSNYTYLRVEAGSTAHGSILELGDSTDSNYGAITQFASAAGEDGRMRFTAGGTETMNLRSGNVGIGTSSPDAKLTTQRSGSAQGVSGGYSLKGQDGTTQGGIGTDGVNDNYLQILAAQGVKFHTSNIDGTTNERTRIDSSGNVLVGTTDANPTNNNTNSAADSGIAFSGGQGWIANTTYNETTAYFNRTGTDGTIIELIKSGSTVGSIQSRAGVVSTIVLDPRSGQGAGLTGAGAGGDTLRHITPTNESGVEVSGKVSLGNSNNRFKDLYLSGGVSFDDNPTAVTGNVSSKTLDDYEEGTWSPAIRGDSLWSAGTQGYTTRTGNYVKVGAFVYLSFDVQVNGLGTVAGSYLQVGNFPFTVEYSNLGGGNVSYYSSLSNTSGPLLMYAASTQGYLMEGETTYVALSDATDSTRLIGTIMYKTTQ